MTDACVDRLPATPFLGINDDGWAIFAEAPGLRDLGSPEVWGRSLHRSRERRRRVAARRPGLPTSAGSRMAAAVMAVSVFASASGATVASGAQPTSTAGLDGVLKRGSHGPQVATLQRRLGVRADGVFGPGTFRAVRAHQRRHGLEVDGVVGPATRASLGLGHAGSARASTSSPGTPVLASAVGIVVPRATATAVQGRIGVSADGDFGPRSRAALARWQRAHGLTADGIPGPQTLAAMGLSGAAPARAAKGVGTAAEAGVKTSAVSDAAGAGATAAAGTSAGSGLGAAVSAARGVIGTPYGYGGNGPGTFDCSGLTVYAFAKAGVSLPRTSEAQFGMGTPVDHADVRAGDLVFFDTGGSGASHVGIATGPSTAISATTHGVMEHSTTDSYWGAHYVGARRVG